MPKKEEVKEVKDTKGKTEAASKDVSAADKSVSSRLSNNPEMSEGLKDVLQDKEKDKESKEKDLSEVKKTEESDSKEFESKSDDGADLIESELSEILAEEAKTSENKSKEKDADDESERSDKNIQREIQRKVKQEMEKYEAGWKKDHGLDTPPPQQDPEAVREMLRTRYPKMFDTLGEDVIKDIFNFNQNQYDEVVKPGWEKDQFDRSNKSKAEQEARKAIADKPYYKALQPLMDKLEKSSSIAKQLSGTEKFEYLYDKAFSTLAPRLIQKKIQGMQKQVKEKHTVIPADEVVKQEKTDKRVTLGGLSEKAQNFAERAGLTEDDLNNPLYEQGGTIIDIDKQG